MDFHFWTHLVLQPQEMLKDLKPPSDWFSVFKVWAVTGFWAGLASGLVGLLTGGISGVAILGFLISLLLSPVIYPIMYVFVEGIHFIVARALGGTGSFRDQYYFIGLTGRLLLPLSALFTGFSMNSPVFFLLGIFASALVGLVWLYPQTVVYRKVHGFDWLKAILVWLIPSIIFTVLGLLFLLLFIGIIASSAASAAALNATG